VPSYITYNGPAVTTAAFAPVTTGTAIKTMLQIKAPSAAEMLIWKWGISFDGTGTTPIKCELIDTGTVAATVTAAVAAGVQNYGPAASAVTSAVQLSTTGTGYTASAEGSITTTRYGDLQQINPGNYFQNEWSLGREFYVPPGDIVRVRVTASAAVNCTCWIVWDE
jgi:hypothetical protein